MSEVQTTLFDAIKATDKPNMCERPETWRGMLFPVEDVCIFVENVEVESVLRGIENPGIKQKEAILKSNMDITSIPEYKGILNMDTGEILSVVKKTYHAVSNIDVLEHFEGLLRDQGIRFEYGFAVSARNGRKTVFEIILPDLTIDLGNGDTQDMRLYLQNSFDGGNAIKLDMGFFRHKCSNMALMVGKAELQYKTSHIGDATDRIKTTFNMYLTEKFNEAKGFINLLIKHSFDSVSDVLTFINDEENKIIADRYRPILEELWLNVYKPEFDSSFWGVYNAYTEIITHQMKGSNIGKMDKLVKLSDTFNSMMI